MKTIIITVIMAMIAASAKAECRTIIVKGTMTTCCTYGNVTNCF